VGNHNDCDVSSFLTVVVNCCLHSSFVHLVQGRGCLVKKHDLRFLQEGSCNGDSLLLASTQLSSSLSNLSVKSFVSKLLLDEVPGIGCLKGFNHLLLGGLGACKLQVFSDCGVEEHGLLANISDALSERLQVQVSNIFTVDEHSTFLSVIESLQQLDHCRLA